MNTIEKACRCEYAARDHFARALAKRAEAPISEARLSNSYKWQVTGDESGILLSSIVNFTRHFPVHFPVSSALLLADAGWFC